MADQISVLKGVYYLLSMTTGRVVLIVRRDGSVDSDLADMRQSLRSSTRGAILNAAAALSHTAAAVTPEEEI